MSALATQIEKVESATTMTDVLGDIPRRTYVGKKHPVTGWPGIIRCIQESRTGSFSRVLRPVGVHSDDGFTWGYAGSGPAETAHAILSDYLEANAAPVIYQRFKHEVVAQWPQAEGWTLPDHFIESWLQASGVPQDAWKALDL